MVEVGCGSGLLAYLLRQNQSTVYTADVNEELVPDILASLPSLPFGSRSIDAVLCFEVLEHMPFGLLAPALTEMRRVCRKYVVMSLPDQSPEFPPSTWWRRVGKSVSRWRGAEMVRVPSLPVEHHWEIGYGDVSVETIRTLSRDCGLCMEAHFRAPMNTYHHFFVLRRA